MANDFASVGGETVTKQSQRRPPPLMSRVYGCCCKILHKTTTGPGVLHSMMFGSCLGVGMYGGLYTFRAMKLLWFDTETWAMQSRQRYQEKQRLFMKELAMDERAQQLSKLSAEYDPVDTRLPFQPLEAKYRF
eukprot:GHVQ01006304.1.p1 GENE.GHVQ01006304.1~~GHVQ01006304.1.p1  ORF type:complete len:133 (+),score=22.30 GHVQ01006304.1:296-694(+)